MCRQRNLVGIGLLSFGAGLVIATVIPNGLLVFLFGIILILAGIFTFNNNF